MSKLEDIGQDPHSEEFVPYTRKGVQRYRRKRATRGITSVHQEDEEEEQEREIHKFFVFNYE